MFDFKQEQDLVTLRGGYGSSERALFGDTGEGYITLYP
jgi:hypothetical protein